MPEECPPDNPILGEAIEISIAILLHGVLFIILSRLLHIGFKRLHQPSAISQLLAGILLGPTVCSGDRMGGFFFPKNPLMYLGQIADLMRVLFMFLIGLEVEVMRAWKANKNPLLLACGIFVACVFISAGFVNLFDNVMTKGMRHGISKWRALPFMTLIFASTSSPVLIEMCAVLKLATSELGRSVVLSSMINDLASFILLLVLASTSPLVEMEWRTVGYHIITFGMFMVLVALGVRSTLLIMKYILPRRIQFSYVWITALLLIIWNVSIVFGFNPMIGGFLLGLCFPRDGKMGRVLAQQVLEPIFKVVLPVYFAYSGAIMDLNIILKKNWLILVLVVTVASMVGKLVGTLSMTYFLKMTFMDGLLITFLLSIKGPLDVMVTGLAVQEQLWEQRTHVAMLVSMLVTTVFNSLLAAYMVRRKQWSQNKGPCSIIEEDQPSNCLQILACLYDKRQLPTILSLIEASRGSASSVLAVHVMHLIKMTDRNIINLLYHQRPEEDHDDAHIVTGDSISNAINLFISETGLDIHRIKACSVLQTMHEDICRTADKTCGSIIILPFHKHRRVDGIMDVTKRGYRAVNCKVLKHANCTVGILIDRGLPHAAHLRGLSNSYNVVVLFFGGADDREATSYAVRIAQHANLNLTFVRFVHRTNKAYDADFENKNQMTCQFNLDMEDEDRSFLLNFYDSYVAAGVVTYIEEQVSNSVETVSVLRSMVGAYSLYIVGQYKHKYSGTVDGLSCWVEYSELGIIGDLLASSDFSNHGSALVICQHKALKVRPEDSKIWTWLM